MRLRGAWRPALPRLGAASVQHQCRLRGKGFPSTTEKPGDLFAEIRIVVPEKLSGRERELFDQLADESKFKARD